MKKSSFVEWPQFPKWQTCETPFWFQFLIVLAFLIVCTAVGISLSFAATVEAVQPDPRVEWVTIDAAGLTVSQPGDSTETKPLPQGSYIVVPHVTTTPERIDARRLS